MGYKFLPGKPCERKVAYNSWATARTELERMKADPAISQRNRLNVYPCNVCGLLHIGRSGGVKRLRRKPRPQQAFST